MEEINYSTQLSSIEEKETRLAIEKEITLRKAYASEDVNAILKAGQMLSESANTNKPEVKSILVDMNDVGSSFGYKDKPFNLSYDVLRGMGRTHIIKSIVETRKEQVASFCTPQKDKYSTGFTIKKRQLLPGAKTKKLTKTEEKRVAEITEFIMYCGDKKRIWHADTFDTFTRKVIQDSLVLDQCCFEVVRNKGDQQPYEFLAVDAGTFRIADSYDDDEYQSNKKEKKYGYTPSYVQIIDGRPRQDYYPWELCFGVRNPSTSLATNGYGRSELEDMIQTVTAIMNSDFYNANFFKVGSSPKGILSYSGNINENSLQDFRRQWMAQTAGVMNMHKIPIINADKINFIPTHVPNKDMEFSKYQEFLIKISCALFKIDPSEIGFPMQGSSEAKPMFEGNNEAKLKFSKDKGLKPLLKQYQYWINKYIVWPMDDSYEFEFQGIDGEMTYQEELDIDIKSLSNFMTLNEIREKRGLSPREDGDIILNPIWLQNKMSQQQAQQGGQEGEQGDVGDQNQSPFMDDEEENPFLKSLDLEKLLS